MAPSSAWSDSTARTAFRLMNEGDPAMRQRRRYTPLPPYEYLHRTNAARRRTAHEPPPNRNAGAEPPPEPDDWKEDRADAFKALRRRTQPAP